VSEKPAVREPLLNHGIVSVDRSVRTSRRFGNSIGGAAGLRVAIQYQARGQFRKADAGEVETAARRAANRQVRERRRTNKTNNPNCTPGPTVNPPHSSPPRRRNLYTLRSGTKCDRGFSIRMHDTKVEARSNAKRNGRTGAYPVRQALRRRGHPFRANPGNPGAAAWIQNWFEGPPHTNSASTGRTRMSTLFFPRY
jgi:hypothetical protein